MTTNAIKIGLVAELTGPLSFMGQADANVAKIVADDINAGGGLLGRPVRLIVEDGATIDSVAFAKATWNPREMLLPRCPSSIISVLRHLPPSLRSGCAAGKSSRIFPGASRVTFTFPCLVASTSAR